MDLSFGSVCSGIEAASVAWHPLGWRGAWLAEIEPFPAALLAHHYPNVPNLGDMTKIAEMVRAGAVAAPDVLVGGTPCQAFSIAGLRNSLDDARGQLTLSFVDLANAIDAARLISGRPAATIVWENVPGVLSTPDNAFGYFLAGLAGEDEAIVPAGKKWSNAGCVFGPQRAVAWRVLDAQYFGVAQRRRRVFVVASAREGFDPAAVLLEFEGVRRDSPPSRQQGQEAATGTLRSTDGGSDVDHAHAGHLLTCVSNAEGSTGLPFLTCSNIAKTVNNQTPLLAFSSKDYGADCTVDLSPTLRAGGHSSSHANAGVPPDIAFSTSGVGYWREGIGPLRARPQDSHENLAVCVTGEITHTLKAEGFDASEDGTGRGQPIVAAWAENSRAELRYENGDGAISGALTSGGGKAGQSYPVAQIGMAVRRLTPRECERLQAFPDDYTLIPVRGKPAADGPRYKALGNSMCVYNMRWIGQRIDAALQVLEQVERAAA